MLQQCLFEVLLYGIPIGITVDTGLAARLDLRQPEAQALSALGRGTCRTCGYVRLRRTKKCSRCDACLRCWVEACFILDLALCWFVLGFVVLFRGV